MNNCCFILNCLMDNVIVYWCDVLLNKDMGVYVGYLMFNNEEKKIFLFWVLIWF